MLVNGVRVIEWAFQISTDHFYTTFGHYSSFATSACPLHIINFRGDKPVRCIAMAMTLTCANVSKRAVILKHRP